MPEVCDRPAAVKQSNVIWLTQNDPPPTPACFDNRRQWQDYLRSLHESGERITRVQDTAFWTMVNGVKVRTHRFLATVWERVPYCEDCDIGGKRQLRMQDEKRCVLPKGLP